MESLVKRGEKRGKRKMKREMKNKGSEREEKKGGKWKTIEERRK